MVTIATSIMPTRAESQKEAIRSWLDLGFDVVSVNVGGEVEALHREFPGVRFVTVERPERAVGDRPHVRLSELLAVLANMPERVCGIVNSDIRFCAGADFQSFIEEHALDSMVFGSRMECRPECASAVQEYLIGFDYFFFNSRLSALFPQTGLRLGMPRWDYWLPLQMLFLGGAVKRLVTPVAYHRFHEAQWDGETLEEFGRYFLDSMPDNHSCHCSDSTVWRLLGIFPTTDLNAIAGALLHYLRFSAGLIHYRPPDMSGGVLLLSADSFQEMIVNKRALEEQVEAYERQLAALTDSRSWRLTAPLRAVRRALGPFTVRKG